MSHRSVLVPLAAQQHLHIKGAEIFTLESFYLVIRYATGPQEYYIYLESAGPTEIIVFDALEFYRAA
ncbi:hypothetical protein ACLOJK_033165 [Asimina triloba]